MNNDTTVRARRDCSPYPEGELARFKAILESRRSEVLRSCEGLSVVALRRSGAVDDSQITDDTADLASDASEQDLSLSILGRAQEELTEIAGGLERIDRRSYGVCDDCGKPISLSRLEAIPTASLCTPCKARSETE